MKTKKITSRQAQAIETREKIYKTAYTLMEKKGFQNISIEDISKKAGVSVGSFYHYFKSKNDILFEVYQRADNYIRENAIGKLQSENSLDQIVEFFQIYARYSQKSNIEFTKHLYSTENKFFLKKGRLMQSVLEDIIESGQDKNEITKEISAEEISEYLFLIARGVIFDWCLRDGQYDLEEKTTELFKLQVKLYKI